MFQKLSIQVVCWLFVFVTAEGKDLPNFVFLISDDHSAADLGCYGNSSIHTPNLDRLAREGMRFENAFPTSPQCSPSRSSILAGRSPHAIGTSRLHSPMPARQETIIELLTSAGYVLGAYRKVHQGEEFQKRWNFVGDAKESFAAFFEKRPKDRPFYLHVGFTDPHRPYQRGAFSPPHDPDKVMVPGFLPDTPKVREELALYYDEIARMDRECGELLQLLERQGLVENTLVIFTADNGMPFPGAKGTLYEAGVRVPLIARWPGKIKPGQLNPELVSLIDLPVTWLEAAGLDIPAYAEGHSLVGAFLGGSHHPRQVVFFERNWHDNLDLIRGVRTDRYKLIQNYKPELPYRPIFDVLESPTWENILQLKQARKLTSQDEQRFFHAPRPQVELYDLQNDPGENTNLAQDPAHQQTLQKLQQLLSRWMSDTNDFLPPPVGAFTGEKYKNKNPL